MQGVYCNGIGEGHNIFTAVHQNTEDDEHVPKPIQIDPTQMHIIKDKTKNTLVNMKEQNSTKAEL